MMQISKAVLMISSVPIIVMANMVFASVDEITREELACNMDKAPRLKTVSPNGLYDPLASGIASLRVDKYTRMAYISGQMALDRDGEVVQGDLKHQLRVVFGNLRIALTAIQAHVNDIVSATTYVVDMKAEDFKAIRVLADLMGNPPNTIVSVSGLFRKELVVAVDFKVALKAESLVHLFCHR